MSAQVHFELLDYWHVGAGHGAGRRIDAVVVRTPSGLPFIPGRTVKGLLRSAVRRAEIYGHLEAGITELIFGGRDIEREDPLGRFDMQPGILRVGSATLSKEWERYAATEDGFALVESFFDELSNTAIDPQDGMARDGSLRRIEVAIPLQLSAEWHVIEAQKTSTVRAALERALPLLRGLGMSRNRGLGRVRVSLQGGQR